MTTESTSLRSLFSASKIFPGSKRLSLGQNEKTPPQMLRDLVADPAALSVTLHELAHFHSLISPLGVILTARALTRGHWLDRALSIAEERVWCSRSRPSTTTVRDRRPGSPSAGIRHTCCS